MYVVSVSVLKKLSPISPPLEFKNKKTYVYRRNKRVNSGIYLFIKYKKIFTSILKLVFLVTLLQHFLTSKIAYLQFRNACATT